MSQDDIFLKTEGDQWFSRNKDYLKNKKEDIVYDLIKGFDLLSSKSSVLEVGCATGYRLAKISDSFGCKTFGVEASLDAVNEGMSLYHGIELVQGSAAELPYNSNSMDLLIINFVLHWIDRNNLIKVLSELDRVIKPGGFLIIGDFYPLFPEKRLYHHISEPLVYTYKQNYAQLMVATNLYELIHFSAFNHSTLKQTAIIDHNERCFLSLLKKGADLYVNK